MRKFITLLALAAIAAPAAAADWTATQFSRDGETYKVRTSTTADNVQRIRGFTTSGTARFDLRVKDGRVLGWFNGKPVNFAASEITPDRLASR
jgi:opacity protein-like surface antigen